METIDLHNRIEIVDLFYNGIRWVEQWGTWSRFGQFGSYEYSFGVRLNLSGLLSTNILDGSWVTGGTINIPFSVGNYAGNYYVFSYNEQTQTATFQSEKTIIDNSFTINLSETEIVNDIATFLVQPATHNPDWFAVIDANSFSVNLNYTVPGYTGGSNISYDNNQNPFHVFDYAIPNGIPSGTTVPLVITLHGGSWSTKIIDDNITLQKQTYQSNKPFILSCKCIYVSLEYRLVVRDQNDAFVNNQYAAQTYDDMLSDISLAINYLTNDWQYSSLINTDKIFLMGVSAGAHVSLLYAYRSNSYANISIAGVISEAGPTTLSFDDDIINYLTQNNVQLLYIDSPLNAINQSGGKKTLLAYSKGIVTTGADTNGGDGTIPYLHATSVFDALNNYERYLSTFNNKTHSDMGDIYALFLNGDQEAFQYYTLLKLFLK